MTKRMLFVTILSLLFVKQGFSQSFTLGPKVGYANNNLELNIDSITSGMNNQYQFGLFMRIGSKIYIQPELYYTIKGGTLQYISSNAEQQIYLKSLVVPVLVGVMPIKIGKFNLRLMGGPTFTYVFNKEIQPNEIGKTWPINSIHDLKENQFSVMAGAGIDIFFLTLDVKYEFGMNNIYKGDAPIEVKNNIINVSLGLKLF